MQSYRYKPFNICGQPGFTVAEMLIALGMLAVIAAMLLPHIFMQNNGNKFDALIRESYSTLGEMTLSCQQDTNYAAAINSPCSPGSLAQYLYDHLNFSSTSFSSRPSLTGDYSVNQPYFTLPLGASINQIVQNGNLTQILVQARNNNSTNAYIIDVDTTGNRYTTAFGYTQDASQCTLADVSLHIANSCAGVVSNPVSIPVQAPVQTTIVQTPVQAPVQTTTVQTPVQAPVQTTTVQTPVQAPVQTTTVQTPVQAPMQTTTVQKPAQGQACFMQFSNSKMTLVCPGT